jgi:hypothetical protein
MSQTCLINTDKEKVQGKDVLEKIFKRHCDTVNLTWKVKLKFRLRSLESFFIKLLKKILKMICYILRFNYKYKNLYLAYADPLDTKYVPLSAEIEPTSHNDVTNDHNINTINLLGITAKEKPLKISAFIICLIFLIYYNLPAENNYLSKILSKIIDNNFLAIIFTFTLVNICEIALTLIFKLRKFIEYPLGILIGNILKWEQQVYFKNIRL